MFFCGLRIFIALVSGKVSDLCLNILKLNPQGLYLAINDHNVESK